MVEVTESTGVQGTGHSPKRWVSVSVDRDRGRRAPVSPGVRDRDGGVPGLDRSRVSRVLYFSTV